MIYTTTPLKIAPAGAAGATLTPSGTAWVDSAAATLIASAGADLVLGDLKVTSGYAASFEIDIYAGATRIATRAGVKQNSNEMSTGDTLRFGLPIDLIPLGSAVTAKLRTSTTSVTTWSITMSYYEKPMAGNLTAALSTSPAEVLPSAQAGVALTPNASAYTNSAWVQVASSLAAEFAIDQVYVDPQGEPPDYLIDVSTSASAGDIVTTVRGWSQSSFGFNLAGHNGLPVFPCRRVPAGSDLWVRLRKTGTSVTAWAVKIGGYYTTDATAFVTDQRQQWSSDGARPPAVTCGAPGPGAWVELIASLAAESALTAVAFDPTSNNGVRAIEIGVGPLGSEQTLFTMAAHCGVFASACGSHLLALLRVQPVLALGTRVVARTTSTVSGRADGISVGYREAPDCPEIESTAGTAAPGLQNTTDLSVTAPGSWGTGSYTAGVNRYTLPAAAYVLAALHVEIGITADDQEFDIAVGGSGSEVLQTTVRANSGLPASGALELPIPHLFAASDVVSIRARAAGSGYKNLYLDFFLYEATRLARVTQVVQLVFLSRPPDPAVLTPPAGGGTVNTGTDPAAGVDLCGGEVPVAFVDITPPGGSTRRYSAVPINRTVADDPRVKSFGRVTRALTNRQGDLRGSTASPTLLDSDRFLRGLEASDSLVNAIIEYYLTTQAALIAGSTPRRVFSGLVTDCEPLSGLEVRLQASDYLQAILDQQPPPTFPGRVFSLEDFPNLGNDPHSTTSPGNPSMVGKPVPVGYGLLSDESAGIAAKGVVPGIYTGPRYLPTLQTVFDEYVFFGHAPTEFQSLFVPSGPTLSTGPGFSARDRIVASGAGEWVFPGSPEWVIEFGSQNYVDLNGRRYCVAYGRGPRSLLSRSGEIPLVANLAGVEDVGDGTGTLIDSLPLQVCHLLINFVLQTYASGAWLTSPVVNSYARVRTSSFEAVKTRTEVRIAGGHIGAFLLAWDGTPLTLQDLARRFYEHGIYLGQNKDGQIIASAVNPDAAAVRSVSDILDRIQDSFQARRRRDELRNRVLYQYARRYVPSLTEPTPAEGEFLPGALHTPQVDWEVDTQEDTVPASITKYGQRTMDLSLELTRDAATAADLAAHHLEVLAWGPVTASYQEGLCGTNVDLGDNVALTDYLGIAASGWTDRLLRGETHTLDLDAMRVELEALDVASM